MNRTIVNGIDPAGNCLQVNGVLQVATDIAIPPNITSRRVEDTLGPVAKFLFHGGTFKLVKENVSPLTFFEKIVIRIKKILFFKLF